MACHYLGFAASLPDSPPQWDADTRPRTRSSTATDVSCPGEAQQGASCGSAGTTATGQPRRRIGRPIAYTGDPDAQHLTEAERRRIKRRIANRESARRVRRKRQNALEDMQEKLEQVQGHALTLSARLQQAESERAQLVRQLREMHRRAGEAGDDVAAAAAGQQEVAGSPPPFGVAAAGPFQICSFPALELHHSPPDAGSPSRSGATNNSPSGGGGVGGGQAPELSQPMQPTLVAVTPATGHTRVHCSASKPAMPLSPGASKSPRQSPQLLDLQSMPSADDPLDCFLRKPSAPMEDAAAVPLGLDWRF